MDTQQLTAARAAFRLLSGSDTFWTDQDCAVIDIVGPFLETLPPLFAEIEHLRVQADAHAADKAALTRTIRELRDQIVTERGISDERLLKIENMTRTVVSGEPDFIQLNPCRTCGFVTGNHHSNCPLK
jgi:hypothetical protein